MSARNLTLPPNRTLEQLRNHYEIEKEIAGRLRRASREERRAIYPTMYDELFARVPDHSRLQIREDPRLTAEANATKWKLVEKLVKPTSIFVEFAPGSCRFAIEVCDRVASVYGIDISDQSGQLNNRPGNFELVVYNGYELDMDKNFADIVFSDQLLEHFHPDDTTAHLELVRHILKPGGVYVFRTPHRLSGPHDVSQYFSDEPEGFHLKEWTYREFHKALGQAGFSSWSAFRLTKGHMLRVPIAFFIFWEVVLGSTSRRIRVPLAARIFSNIILIAKK